MAARSSKTKPVPPSEKEVLSPFESRDVIAARIEIPNAGGGLNNAMEFEPREWGHDDEVTVVLRCSVRKIRFDEVKDTDGCLARVHVLHAAEATFLEGELVDAALADQRERIRRAKEEAAGVQRLPTDEELYEQHKKGNHFALVENCVECQTEEEARLAEQANQ